MTHTPCFPQFPAQSEMLHKTGPAKWLWWWRGGSEAGVALNRGKRPSLLSVLTAGAPSQSLSARVAPGFKELWHQLCRDGGELILPSVDLR